MTKNKRAATQQMMATAVVVLVASFGPVMANADGTGASDSAIGIDLGTTYSVVSVYENGKSEILTNQQGNRITPSYVAWNPETCERMIGDAAKNQLTTNPHNTIFDVKRLIGRRYEEIQQLIGQMPFKIINKNGFPVIDVETCKGKRETFTPEQISGMVLGHMKTIAEDYLGKEVTKAVVTVPAYFKDAQRQATRDAGIIAGLDIIRIINEPTSAAIAYGMSDTSSTQEKNILVFDLGGGTFDVSVLTIDNGVFEVLATGGDTHLGGENFDEALMDHFINLVKKKHGIDISTNHNSKQKLRRECEKAKRALSSSVSTKLVIEELAPGIDLDETLTRAKFEQLNDQLFKKTMEPVAQAIKDSGLTKSEFDEVVIVGGSTRIPKIQKLLTDFFNGKELAKGINPDEAVAWGAGVHAAVLTGKYQHNIVVIDTTPLSIGIETVGGVFTAVVPKNTNIPVKRSKVFSTAADNQESVSIVIFEGERAKVKDNHLLGKFDLNGIRPAPRGQPQIEVEFGLDANGILTVTATDKDTGEKAETVISNDGRLSQKEIEEMIRVAEEKKGEDDEFRNRKEAFNEFEAYVYKIKSQSEKAELEPQTQEFINNEVERCMEWLNSQSDDPPADESNQMKTDLEENLKPYLDQLYASSDNSNPEKDEL